MYITSCSAKSCTLYTNTLILIVMFLSIYQVLVLSVVRFEIKFSLHVFSSINVVVYTRLCSHCTLHASLVQVILCLRVLLFILIYSIFSCMTYMKIIGHDCKNINNKNNLYVVKMKLNVVLNACHNNYWQVSTINCENKISVIYKEINIFNACHNY